MDPKPYQEFAEAKLGFKFDDPSLIVTALTHRSYVNEHKTAHQNHNERLEFLGDAVLELVTSDFLFKNFDKPEGIMTAWRSALVRTESISSAGYELGYEPLIRLSHGERNGTDRAHAVIIADCFEALTGAIYLDKGYDEAKKFIEKHILVKIDEILEEGSWRDPKSYFQELAQRAENETPVYHTIKEEGPDHDKTFTVAVYTGKTAYGVGVGHSKQIAQTEAARQGIEKIKAAYPHLFSRKKFQKPAQKP
ncbi:ribonuclease III [Candidatus Saccharibacteria bacterium]|nr:ribonuclease III [Candidatus Saccharibacteria bacterium]